MRARVATLLLGILLLALPFSHAFAPAYVGHGEGRAEGTHVAFTDEICGDDLIGVGLVYQDAHERWVPQLHYVFRHDDARVPCMYEHMLPIQYTPYGPHTVTGSPEEGFFIDFSDDCHDWIVTWGPLGPATDVRVRFSNTCGPIAPHWANFTLSFPLPP